MTIVVLAVRDLSPAGGDVGSGAPFVSTAIDEALEGKDRLSRISVMRQTPNEVRRRIGRPREEVPDEGVTRRAEYFGAPAADRVATEWDSATYLKLNTRPEVRQFFEHCLKYHCTDLSLGGGRDYMLAAKELSPPANVKDRNNPNRASLLAGPMPWTT